MALSKNISLNIVPAGPDAHMEMPVKASTNIYMGAAVSDSGGNGLAAGLTAAEAFVGFAHTSQADNSTGAASDISVKLVTEGVLKGVSVSGVDAATDFGIAVYMSDDATFTDSSSGNTKIGSVQRYDAVTGKADVFFQGAFRRVS